MFCSDISDQSNRDKEREFVLRAFRGLSRWLGHRRWFAALARPVMAPVDRALYRLSRGRVSIGGAVAPVLLLTTTGRRSGKPRTTPLIYIRDGADFVVSSEDFGQDRPAAWRLNLVADGRAIIQVRDEVIRCRGELLSDAEAERYWGRLTEVWPAHETYRRRSGQRHTFILRAERARDGNVSQVASRDASAHTEVDDERGRRLHGTPAR